MEKRSNEELAVLAQSGDGVAFERLWKQTEGFVVSEIKKLKDDYNFEIKRHMQDLKLCGKVGIARGMERFDITRGCTFLTYAGWWVKKELMLFMDEEIKHQQEIPMSRASLKSIRWNGNTSKRIRTSELWRILTSGNSG